jgi:hypothetical protein
MTGTEYLRPLAEIVKCLEKIESHLDVLAAVAVHEHPDVFSKGQPPRVPTQK